MQGGKRFKNLSKKRGHRVWCTCLYVVGGGRESRFVQKKKNNNNVLSADFIRWQGVAR